MRSDLLFAWKPCCCFSNLFKMRLLAVEVGSVWLWLSMFTVRCGRIRAAGLNFRGFILCVVSCGWMSPSVDLSQDEDEPLSSQVFSCECRFDLSQGVTCWVSRLCGNSVRAGLNSSFVPFRIPQSGGEMIDPYEIPNPPIAHAPNPPPVNPPPYPGLRGETEITSFTC